MSIIIAVGWIVIVIMGCVSIFIIFANYSILIQEIRTKFNERQPSMIPVAGGLLGALAIYTAASFTGISASLRLGSHQPTPGWSWYAWIPILLDPGFNFLIGFLASAIVMTFTGKAYWCKKNK